MVQNLPAKAVCGTEGCAWQVVALVRGNDLWVANAGDSRCVASRRGRALALTHDHKPTDQVEMQRIAKVSSPSFFFLSTLVSLKLLCFQGHNLLCH